MVLAIGLAIAAFGDQTLAVKATSFEDLIPDLLDGNASAIVSLAILAMMVTPVVAVLVVARGFQKSAIADSAHIIRGIAGAGRQHRIVTASLTTKDHNQMTGTSPIGAVIAMEVELQHLLAQGHIKQEGKQGPWREVRLQIGEHEVMAVLCGIGMVNAAAATEYLIGAHRPRIIVNSGCTGAHVAELLPGDVVIGTSVIYHAAMQILATGEERYTGFSFETITRDIKTPALPTDPGLVDIAQRVAETTRHP